MFKKLQAGFSLTENVAQPKWLAHLAPHAKIHIIWADVFGSLKGPQDSSLGDCVKMATGGRAAGSTSLLPHSRLQSSFLGLGRPHALLAIL